MPEVCVGLVRAAERPGQRAHAAAHHAERAERLGHHAIAQPLQVGEEDRGGFPVAQFRRQLSPDAPGTEPDRVSRELEGALGGRSQLALRLGLVAGLVRGERGQRAKEPDLRRADNDEVREPGLLREPALVPADGDQLSREQGHRVRLAGVLPEREGGLGQTLGLVDAPGQLRAPGLLRGRDEPQPRILDAPHDLVQVGEDAVGLLQPARLGQGCRPPHQGPEPLVGIAHALGEAHGLIGRLQPLGEVPGRPYRRHAHDERVRERRGVAVTASQLDGLVAQRPATPVVFGPQQLCGEQGQQARPARVLRRSLLEGGLEDGHTLPSST